MRGFPASFASLRNRNFRLYFSGQLVSVCGTWMQKLGQAWLVLELSGSGTLLGVTAALQHLPTLLAGPWGGLLADRLSKRRILLWTQGGAGLLGLLLAALTWTGAVQVWMVLVLALALGTVHSLDKPTRHTFVMEMVGPKQLTNAIALNSVVVHTGMLVGPALGGMLISHIGLAPSFLLNGLSYGAVVAALLLMDTSALSSASPATRAKGQVRAGLGYVRRTPGLIGPILLMAALGMFAFEWSVTLPLLAVEAFDGEASTFGLMFSAIGVGAVVGGLGVAGYMRSTAGSLALTALLLGLMMAGVAAAPSYGFALVVLVLVGAATIAVRAAATSLLQLNAVPEMRGRVMALLAVSTSGMRPIGAPIVGWVGETFGPRPAVALGAVSTATAAITMYLYLRRRGVIGARREPELADAEEAVRGAGARP